MALDSAFGGAPVPVVAAVFEQDEATSFDRSRVSYNVMDESDATYFNRLEASQ